MLPLALMVAPEQACFNLQRLAEERREGAYGLYESVDYTPSRLTRGEKSVVVRSFMAHHQGMSLLSFDYALLDRPMQKRFEADPRFQATTLPETPVSRFTDPNSRAPEVQFLSNGRYHVITSAGGGYSRWKELAVTRWREDPTRDSWGAFVYIRDLASGNYWSAAYQPTLALPLFWE